MQNTPLANPDELRKHWPIFALVILILYSFWHYNTGKGR